jgi:hypothetical protein
MNTAADITEVLQKVASYLAVSHHPLLDVHQLRMLQQVADGARAVDYGDLSNLIVRFEKPEVDGCVVLEVHVDNRARTARPKPYMQDGNERCNADLLFDVSWHSSGTMSIDEALVLKEFYSEALAMCSMVRRAATVWAPAGVSYVSRSAASIKEAAENEEQKNLDAYVASIIKLKRGLRVGASTTVCGAYEVRQPHGTYEVSLPVNNSYADDRLYTVDVGLDPQTRARRAVITRTR